MVTLVNWNSSFTLYGYDNIKFKILAVYKCPNYEQSNFIAVSENGVIVDCKTILFKMVMNNDDDSIT